MLGHGELAFVVVVPGGGDFDDVVAAGEGGHIDGAAARLCVGDDGIPPVVVDGYIIGGADIIHNGDNASHIIIINIRHICRDVPLSVIVFFFSYFHMNICRISVNVSKCHNRHHT